MIKNIAMSGQDEIKQALAQLGKNAYDAALMGMNATGRHMQRSMRGELPKRFTMRGTASQFERAIVFQQATRGKLVTVAGVDSLISFQKRQGVREAAVLKVGSDQGGTKATATNKLGRILARHEEAGVRTSAEVYRAGNQTFVGGFFLPAEGMRTSSANPKRSLYPTSIGIQMRRDVDGSGTFAKSKRKTTFSRKSGQLRLGESFYAIPGVGIFRRRAEIGPKVKGQRGEPLWWFSRRVRTPARLRLWETADQVFQRFAVAYTMDAVETVLERGGR
jgi:hypothetical protein